MICATCNAAGATYDTLVAELKLCFNCYAARVVVPEEIPDGFVRCSECKGKGAVDCEECDGEGERTCDMGHDHECRECDASGQIKCVGCKGCGRLRSEDVAA